MKKIWFKSVCVALAGLSLASCGDFLQIYPLTMVYEDNYWNEKNDVDQIVAGCYTRMQDDDFMRRVFLWGEVRSDNVSYSGGKLRNPNVETDEAKFANENIISTNVYTTWDAFYSVIDRCNLVIAKIPEVAAADPSYLESDQLATIAEVSALRALCYFYLVRTFKDVPYYTEAITNDEQPLNLPATKGEVILQNLIADLESVWSNALTAWPMQDGVDVSYGRITQNAIFALLADMHLWLGNFTQAADYADRVIESKKRYFTEHRAYPSLTVDGEMWPLIPDNGPTYDRGLAYRYNFGLGSMPYGSEATSPESVFELNFSNDIPDATAKGNPIVYSLFRNIAPGVDPDWGIFSPSAPLESEFTTASVFKSTDDSRICEAMYDEGDAGVSIAKYVYAEVVEDNETGETFYSVSLAERNVANWVFYRVSEIMLIKAEALIYQMTDDGSEHNEELRSKAFALINAVEARSSLNARSLLEYDDYPTRESLVNLVYEERRRELMFEGKRWFDLVRRSLRDGNTTYLSSQVRSKYSSAMTANKFGNPDAMYLPYNHNEVVVNENLHQNPAYPEEGESYESTVE